MNKELEKLPEYKQPFAKKALYKVLEKFYGETEERIKKIAIDLKAKASIYYQDEALGTAHAILSAKEALHGKVIVAFADTLFKADFKTKLVEVSLKFNYTGQTLEKTLSGYFTPSGLAVLLEPDNLNERKVLAGYAQCVDFCERVVVNLVFKSKSGILCNS